ncbi:hypothetical protein BH11PSE3_BH11PSE3_08240 [soil metagenome]
MRGTRLLLAVAVLALLSGPAIAEPRWLACKYADGRGATHDFYMVFDDLRSTASVLENGQLIEGANTNITFQALRSRFPMFMMTYNRNDGALALNPLQGGGGLLQGKCGRTAPPAGAPRP